MLCRVISQFLPSDHTQFVLFCLGSCAASQWPLLPEIPRLRFKAVVELCVQTKVSAPMEIMGLEKADFSCALVSPLHLSLK